MRFLHPRQPLTHPGTHLCQLWDQLPVRKQVNDDAGCPSVYGCCVSQGISNMSHLRAAAGQHTGRGCADTSSDGATQTYENPSPSCSLPGGGGSDTILPSCLPATNVCTSQGTAASRDQGECSPGTLTPAAPAAPCAAARAPPRQGQAPSPASAVAGRSDEPGGRLCRPPVCVHQAATGRTCGQPCQL